jgi:anti-sigma regulatory factor (Ser/Thr protein kinase)/PAS domain-containing protein
MSIYGSAASGRFSNAGMRTFLHAQLPFAAAAAVLVLLTAIAERGHLADSWFLAAVGLIAAGTLIPLLLDWRRSPTAWVGVVVPAADLVAVALLSVPLERFPALTLLAVFPLMWLAYRGRIRSVILANLLAVLSAAFPLVVSREERGSWPSLSEILVMSLLPFITIALTVSINIAGRFLEEKQRQVTRVSESLAHSLRVVEEREATIIAMANTLQAAVALYDDAGTLVLENEASRQLSGRTMPDGPDGATQIFEADRTTPVTMAQLRERVRSDDTGEGATYWAGPLGDQVAVALTSGHSSGADGRSLGTVVVGTDVTRYVDAIRVREEFLATVSHELKTPLTSIVGYLDLLEDAAELTHSEHAPTLAILKRNTQRLQGLVSDLLAAADSNLSVRKRRVDLGALVLQAVDGLQPRALDKGLLLGSSTCLPSLIGEVDPVRIGQVVDNLLSNAIKYTPAGGSVHVELEQDGADALIRVIDTGVGLSDGDQKQIFDRFFRATSARDDAIPGVGLGLAIVRSIVAAHEGSVTVDSEVDAGTIMTVRLPLVAAPAAESLPDGAQRQVVSAR